MKSFLYMLKKIIRALCPPIFYKALVNVNRYLSAPVSKKLFGGDDELFKECILNANTYAEYGCGASTIWVFNNTTLNILSVDSSEFWLDDVKKRCGNAKNLRLHFANVGKLGDLGTPINYDNYLNFNDYTDWIWEQDSSPDIILVDGRFRVCCFLTSLLRAKEGARIIFDDYTNREEYHIVEKFIKPVKTCGRQALFIVPNKSSFNIKELQLFIDNFRFVFK
jgi:hypothetical protein